jgi:hypothetical protein
MRALLLLISGILFAAEAPAPHFDAARYVGHVKHLASNEFKGRASGSPELEKAAAYIAKQFQAAGLQPLETGTYLQPFQVTTNAKLGKNNRFEIQSPEGEHKLETGKQYQPFNFSASGTFTGNVVFAGYGITAREYNYDDYFHLDVKDKFVLLMRHEPQEFDEKSVFAGKVYTEHSQFFSKAVNAKMHGARGVIFINDTPNHASDSDELETFTRTVGPSNAGIPYVHVKAEVAEQWLASAGKNLKDIAAAIDKDLSTQSFPLPATLTLTLNVDVKRETRTVHNVIGFVPGQTAEHIVIGAHYDHLGLGEQFSLAPSQAGTPHVGADDNASGTAGVIELARYFASRPKMRRGVVFMTFAGEELGLLGSSYYVNNPRYPLDQAVAMINMDMIGRIREQKVYVGGLGTGTTFKKTVEELANGAPLKFEFSDQTGYGSSDHTSFTTKQVPVLFFFSGLHADYHKPSDTWDKIQGEEAARLLDFIAQLTQRLAEDGERPQFVRVAAPPRPVSGGSGSGGGYGPYFGSIPDFAEPPMGVRFSDVREGSPAAKAGLKAGDILIEFGGKPIQNLYDFTYALRGSKVGETVRVKVLRDGKPHEADVLLEQRQ